MQLFTSLREKHLWFWALAVLAAIFSSLFIGQPLSRLLSSQDFQAAIFLFVMLLVAVSILVYGIRTKPGGREIAIFTGLIAVYIMFFLRLGLPERSHLIEYSVLAIFINMAVTERKNQGRKIAVPAIISVIITFLLGVMDESIQIFLPDRVFDTNDILFNGMAVILAIGSAELLRWLRMRRERNKGNKI